VEAVKARQGAKANFLMVYVREAHASDEWVTPDNVKEGISTVQPRTDEERRAAACACLSRTPATMPVVVDGVDDAAARAFGAWPDRMYVLDAEGVVLYRGEPGPFGFLPAEVEAVLARLP
jgi:hypothetical protein